MVVRENLKETQLNKTKTERGLVLFALIVSVIVLIFTLLGHFVYFNVKVVGSSMSPTLYGGTLNNANGDLLFANKLIEPKRGDIVIIALDGEKDWIIKRVIAVEGDVVDIYGGYVYVNGNKIEEPYANNYGGTEELFWEEYTLQKGEYFYLGDNRKHNASKDSRASGKPCSREEIIGVVENWSIAVKNVIREIIYLPQNILGLFS